MPLARNANRVFTPPVSWLCLHTAAGPESKGVMAAVGDPHDRGTSAPRRSLLADGVMALLTAVLVISTVTAIRALAPVAWDALSRASANRATDPSQCALIKNDSERLACFDGYVKELTRPPAKGAFAPPEAFGVKTPASDPRIGKN
jgi:hypothetical protein